MRDEPPLRAVLAGLRRLGEEVRQTVDPHAAVEVVLAVATEVLDPDVAVFWAVDVSNRLVPRACSPGDPADHAVLGPGEGLPGRALRDGVCLRWPGGQVAPSVSEPVAGASTGLAAPIRLAGRAFGAIGLYRRHRAERGAFSEDEAATLAMLVAQAEAALDNAWLYEEARRLSLTDGLTGLWNRRHFDLRISEECQRATRFEEPFGVVMLDIDHFKRINDTLGHQAGDAVLVELARRLSEAVREVDVAARYGGEEFGLVLPRTDHGGAVLLADRVREAIASTSFEYLDVSLSVTASAGVAACPDHGLTVRELVGAADAAMYQAKRAGRNRVVGAAQPPMGKDHDQGSTT